MDFLLHLKSELEKNVFKMYCAILISNRHKTTFAVDQPLVTMFENRQIVLEMIDNISRENSLGISM